MNHTAHHQSLLPATTVTRATPSRVAGLALVISLIGLVSPPTAASQTTGKETVAGVVNYTRVDATVAVGGALSLEALPELVRRGFKSVINLRLPTEPNANVEAEGAAVRAAGLKYINIPFNAGAPDAATQVPVFLKAMADTSNLPVLIHSAGAHRSVAMLIIQRVLVEGWSVEKAFAAEDSQVLADGSAGAKGNGDFARTYIAAHPR
jgi:protein tyrosine phosphatase (PTP) superfamily phosphohydrolase (DUF442 family)